jgi:galactitol-specific phosphotransferase system IIC component
MRVRKFKLGANVTVFVLFFGIATLEAFQTQNWLKAGFWLAIAFVFLLADNSRKSPTIDS